MNTGHLVEAQSGQRRYLVAVLTLLCLVSLVFPILPGVGASAFSLLVYQDTSYPADFSEEAVSYIRLTNAVLGSVMAGWFIMMIGVVRRISFDPSLWRVIAVGLAVWFVPDTIYSVASGYWQNAVLNTLLLAALAPPLVKFSRIAKATHPSATEGASK